MLYFCLMAFLRRKVLSVLSFVKGHALILAVALFLLSCLIVPYRITWQYKNMSGDQPIGFHLLYFEPTAAEAIKSIWYDLPDNLTQMEHVKYPEFTEIYPEWPELYRTQPVQMDTAWFQYGRWRQSFEEAQYREDSLSLATGRSYVKVAERSHPSVKPDVIRMIPQIALSLVFVVVALIRGRKQRL